jgi:hypothetical protein
VSEAGHGAVDEGRVLLGGGFGTDAKAGHDAGAEVLEDDIGALDQALGNLEIAGRLEVEGDAALSPLIEGIGGVLPAGSARRVDVNDVGALVGEHDARERSGDVLAEVDDANTGEWACHVIPA